jgi:hypothetical protein
MAIKMIDFVKIKITDEALINQVWSNEILEYDGKSEKRFNDELKELVKKKYKNLYFTKYQDRIEISGSLHYFFNNGIHNSNDFSVKDCINTIMQIRDLFMLDLEKCKLINLEYGVNIIPSIDVEDLVHNIMYHEKRQFNRPTKHFYYKIAGNEAYKHVKAYNKSVQFPSLCNNTFRFEVKSKQSKYINSLDLFTLSDLAVTGTYNRLMEELIKEWDNVLLFDLSKNIDKKYLNTYFWEDILKNGNRNKFNNQKKRYYDKLGNNNLHSQIRKTLIQKIQFLKKMQIPSIY